MCVLLEMIAATVGHNAVVEHVDFADGPTIEARLRKQLFEKRVLPNLDVARAQAQSLDQVGLGNGARVAMVEDPANCGEFAIEAGQFENLEIRELLGLVVPKNKFVAVRATDRVGK